MDADQKFVIPRKGLIVRNPRDMSILAEEGQAVDWSGRHGKYWRRRVSCGDVVIGEPATISKPIKKTFKTKEK